MFDDVRNVTDFEKKLAAADVCTPACVRAISFTSNFTAGLRIRNIYCSQAMKFT